jgi:hypothetical protein
MGFMAAATPNLATALAAVAVHRTLAVALGAHLPAIPAAMPTPSTRASIVVVVAVAVPMRTAAMAERLGSA